MNFALDVVEKAPPNQLALIALGRDGSRSEITFAEVADRAARLAGTLTHRGVGRGDVVMTVVGNRPEWVYGMVACFRLGAVALPCTEQLRPKDLGERMRRVEPRAVLVDERDLATVEATGFDGELMVIPDERLFDSDPHPPAELSPTDPALITFTSGTSGEPKPIRHGQRYLAGQHVQAEHWFGARPGDLCWCTAASGWSKSARNVFIAPWVRGATALLQDARFDPGERLATVEREGV
ncbi:MAG TPA: AMP-binding protein, partial [Thermoleophilaceae bacterium]